jgi:hypothetical protein
MLIGIPNSPRQQRAFVTVYWEAKIEDALFAFIPIVLPRTNVAVQPLQHEIDALSRYQARILMSDHRLQLVQ